MKFTRRLLLLAGLGTGSAIAGTQEHRRNQAILRQQDISTAARETLTDHLSIMDAAYASEASWENEVAQRKNLLSNVKLTPPNRPYSRDRSKQLIRFCKLAVQQYKAGRENSSYDGSISLLPAYGEAFENYTQIANFTIEQEIIEDYFKDEMSPNSSGLVQNSALDETFHEVELTLHDRIRHILQQRYRTPVYAGIALTAKTHNVLVFRGTQTQAEWLKNLNAAQTTYVSPTGMSYGEVHEGFLQLMQQLKPSLAEVARRLDPTIPCYICGHSLGAAIATLAAFEIVQTVPYLREQVQLYTYAGPRVGSPSFAERHSQLIPNTYRVINLGDSVPLVPPVTLGNTYVHVGQEWGFLAQFRDVLLNHVVDTYAVALEQELETDQWRTRIRQLQIEDI